MAATITQTPVEKGNKWRYSWFIPAEKEGAKTKAFVMLMQSIFVYADFRMYDAPTNVR